MLSSDRWEWVDRLTDSMRLHEDARQESRKSLPRYEILGELGRGGMAVVYRAWDPELGRPVALKVLQQNLGASPELRERFSREAQMASRLDHPNIVTVYDSGEWDGQGYLAMRLVEGTTLDKAELDLRGKLAAVRDAARALDHAHRQGVVHRDVKPSNLLVDREGHVFVSDFGVARRIDLPSKLTLTGVTVGTPAYISPEQAQGREVDPRSDVYSLGAAMYEVLCGRPPFPGTDALKVMAARLVEDPPPPSRFRPDLSRALDKIVLKAMEREAGHRYATAAAFADDLQRYLDGEPIHARPAPLRFRARRFLSRHGWRVTAMVSLLAFIGVAIHILSRPNPSPVHVPLPPDELGQIESECGKAIEKGDFPKAEEFIERIRKRKPERARYFEELLKQKKLAGLRDKFSAALDREDWDNAAAHLPLIERLDPREAKIKLRELREGQFSWGLRLLQEYATASDAEGFEWLYGFLSGPWFGSHPEYHQLKDLAWTLAVELFNRDQHAGVVRWLTGSLDPEEARRDLLRMRALAWVGLKDDERALSDFRLFEKGRRVGEAALPDYLELLLSLAFRKHEKNLGPEALAFMDEAVKVDSAFAQAYRFRGVIRFRMTGDARAALKDLEAALNLDPKLVPDREYAVMALGLAKALHEEHWKSPDAKAREAAWAEAIRWLSLVRNVEPREPVRLELAGMLRRARRYPEALKELEGMEGTAAGLFARGQVQLVQDRLEEALQDFDRVVRQEPGNGRALHWLGACRQALEQKGESLQALRRAIELGRDVPDIHLRIGLLLLEGNRLDDSIAESTRALDHAAKLGEDCYILRDGEGSRLPFEEVVRIFKRDAGYHRALARYDQKEDPGCVSDCAMCLDLDSAYPRGFMLRALARCRMKEHQAAIDDCNRVIALLQNCTDSEDKARLEKARKQKAKCEDEMKK